VVVLKVYFEKSYDTIEPEAIYQILRKKGLLEKFIAWVKQILESHTSPMLVNGVPGRKYKGIIRGVRKGESPAFPLIFVLGVDLLQDI
jgi:hypothetical protein